MNSELTDIFKRPSAEFPPGAAQWPQDASRRDFMKLMAASLALAGTAGCSDRPDEKLIPYAVQPEGITPGEAVLYASAMPHEGYLRGVLVTTREGRPIKVDGNPDHPASLGGSDVFMQASVLSLYDPDRSHSVTLAGQPASWSAFLGALNARGAMLRQNHGRGLRFLTTPTTSPTLIDQMRQVMQQFPEAKWIEYSPTQRSNTQEGAKLAFGRPLNTIYDFTKAKVIVSLDSDFLIDEPGSLRYARQFAEGRRVRKDRIEMSRLYVIESTLTLTGAAADHRVAMQPSEIYGVASTLLSGLHGSAGMTPQWLKTIVDDLKLHRGQSVVIAGEYQPPLVRALVHAINAELGNVGQTASYIEPIDSPASNDLQSLKELARELTSGDASTLFVLGGNPAANAPADIGLHDALLSASNNESAFTVHLGLYNDDTARVCQWHVPQSHYLETWSDGRAFDGTASIIQPTINPLYGGKSVHEVIEALLGRPGRSSHDIIRDHWLRDKSEGWWTDALRKGVVPDTASKRVTVRPALVQEVQSQRGDIELAIRPDPNIGDGSFANNPWLQELPRPFTKLVWDNAALISPGLATKLDVISGQIVRIESAGRSIDIPAMILPGLPDGTVTLHLGYGGKHGVDVYPVRTSTAMWTAPAKITPTNRHYKLVTTQNHNALEHGDEAVARDVVHVASLTAFRENPHKVIEPIKKPISLSLYPSWDYSKGHQWAMSIDTAACIGCNACVVACQAENNIPVVGKDQVSREREMHWIRIDSYFTGSESSPTITHLPTPCMMCENAPCEYVCPVGATTHSVEGLNQMTYNRCVGTRYCSNNCPYKVRRFNFLS